MQWVSAAVGAIFGDESAASSLQRTGPISKETLLEFFKRGFEMFESIDFKEYLRAAHARGQPADNLITEAQKDVFAQVGVDGNYGVQFLGHVRRLYEADEEFMSVFYQFVAREELVLDEVELSPAEFESKLAVSQRFKTDLENARDHLAGLPDNEKKEYMLSLYKQSFQQCSGCNEQSCAQHTQGVQTTPGAGGQALSQQEQMAFFQSMYNTGTSR